MARDATAKKTVAALVGTEKRLQRIEKKLQHVADLLRDVSMKLCHIIRQRREGLYGRNAIDADDA